jgi:hypothetical protein
VPQRMEFVRIKYRILNLMAAALAGVLALSAPLGCDSLDSGGKIHRFVDLDATLPREQIPDLHLQVEFLPQVPPGQWTKTKNCLPACFAMLRAKQQNSRTVPDMIRHFDDWAMETEGKPVNGYNGSGYSISLLSRYARTLGLGSGMTRKGNLPILVDLLKEGKPVIVSVKRRMKDNVGNRHTMVVVGIDPQRIYVNDPGRSAGTNNSYNLDKFLSVWRTGGNHMFHF